MKKTLLVLFTLLTTSLTINAQYGEFVGGDISLLPSYEKAGDVYLDGKGKAIPDLLKWLVSECGWNTFRVRLFVDPTKESDPAVCQDLDYVKKLGKRIKDVGGKFMLDFHYSDTWADPVKQYLPSSWSDCTTVDKKADKLYSYTKESLEALKAYGATPDFVQVGNEITSGIVGVWRSSDAAGYKKVVEKGCDAVREACPDAKIIIHTERPQNTSNIVAIYNSLDQSKYDVIGLSYYPIWHNNLASLSTTLNKLATSFPDKKVQIVETAYNFQYWPTSGVTYDTRSLWACSAEGQYNFIKDLIAELAKHSNVNGLNYWFPEEAGNGNSSTVLNGWVNRGLWWPAISDGGHWPLMTTPSGMVHYLFKTFLGTTGIQSPEYISKPSALLNSWFTPSGQRIQKPTHKGIYLHNGKKYVME